MRFNSRELAFLAQQPADRFDKEGLLQIKEKQEGIFRKGEVYTERLFRLKGNLLFYFKTKDPHSEPLGVIVLERCAVELDPDEELTYSFVLVFDGEEKVQHLAARSERERDSWFESLHIASYECMKMQLQSLREQLRGKTGKDPIDNPDPSVLPEYKPGNSVETDDPFLEMCFSCTSLPDSGAKPPNSFVSLSYITPPSQQWVTHGHTEIVERNSNPGYMSTIGFCDTNAINMTTKIRLTVYDVKERMTNTMNQIGMVLFTISDLISASPQRIQLKLTSTDFSDPGNIIVMAWQNDSHPGLQNGEVDSQDVHDANSKLPSPSKGKTSKRLEMLRPLYANIYHKTFRLPTNLGGMLSIHEYMGESKLTFTLPKQLLKLWVEEEKSKIEQLQDLGELGQEWDNIRKELMDFHMSSVSMYTQNARYMSGYQGAPFKPSAKKGHKEVEFAPTNLHIQRAWVQNEAVKSVSACYDITTVGAFTAYAQKYKHGGLLRLLKQLREHFSENIDGKNKMEKVNEILNSMSTLQTAVNTYCDTVCRSANQGDSADLNNSMTILADKTRQLIQVCECPLVEQGVTKFAQAKQFIPKSRPYSDPEGYLSAPTGPSTNPSPEKTWKWSGTDFIKSPTEEPWELTRLNTEAALVCITSKVEELMKHLMAGEATKWLEEISPLIIKLKACVEVMCKRAKASLTILSIEECKQNVALMHTIKYRRDVVFSQTLTAAVTAFMTKLRSSITDEAYLRQIMQIGALMEFEALLSCHGDEMGMMEDMAVGVQDLSYVVFKVEQGGSTDDIMPLVKGNSLLREGMYPDFNRTGYTVHIPVPESMFQLLPKEIQRGHTIKVVPVMFNIGINEQATFSERFGDMSTQENINKENFQRLSAYFEKYTEIIGEPEVAQKKTLPTAQIMRHLFVNVMSKKTKNVELLHLAAEMCRKLHGIRFTSCKSAKDRTAMAVTLEQVQLLQREHDLASHAFMQALECLRSEGVRRENTLKNTGSRKYAFNSLQLLSLPKLYRPPHGTFGNVQT